MRSLPQVIAGTSGAIACHEELRVKDDEDEKLGFWLRMGAATPKPSSHRKVFYSHTSQALELSKS